MRVYKTSVKGVSARVWVSPFDFTKAAFDSISYRYSKANNVPMSYVKTERVLMPYFITVDNEAIVATACDDRPQEIGEFCNKHKIGRAGVDIKHVKGEA